MNVILKLAMLASLMTEAAAQNAPLSTDGTDPNTWDPGLDGVVAAAKNHKVIYEDDNIRVLSVTTQPGEVVVPHHHRWPSVIVYDHPVKTENRDAKGNLLPRRAAAAGDTEWPPVLRVPPEAVHSVKNVDTAPLHLIRVEFKKGITPPK